MAMFVRFATGSRLMATRALSTNSQASGQIQKSVFISQSTDPATNQAMEDWLHTSMDLTDHHIMMVYRNEPCVTVGRHQNPWLETNVITSAGAESSAEDELKQRPQLLRRLGGGGSNYLDMGALNMALVMPRADLRSGYVQGLITRALFREYGLKLDVASLDESNSNKMKISGNSTRIGHDAASQSCFLYVDVNKQEIVSALQKNKTDIETNAIKTLEGEKFLNLTDINPLITVDGLIKAVGNEFLRTFGSTLQDGGRQQIGKQRGFQMINPTDNWFPGLDEIHERLTAWQWTFGATPDFSVSRAFLVPPKQYSASSFAPTEVTVTVYVSGGHMADVSLYLPPGLVSAFSGTAQIITAMKGQRFTDDTLNVLEYAVSGDNAKDMFVKETAQKVMSSMI